MQLLTSTDPASHKIDEKKGLFVFLIRGGSENIRV